MDKIIEELVRIESKADDFLAEVYEHKKKLPQRIQKKVAEIQASIDDEAKQKIKILAEEAYKESAEKTQNVIRLSQEQFSSLELNYHNNRKVWEDQIFNNVLGR